MDSEIRPEVLRNTEPIHIWEPRNIHANNKAIYILDKFKVGKSNRVDYLGIDTMSSDVHLEAIRGMDNTVVWKACKINLKNEAVYILENLCGSLINRFSELVIKAQRADTNNFISTMSPVYIPVSIKYLLLLPKITFKAFLFSED
eukprot:GHVP01061756.1.p1 GENE.GHVP01061756.1~~GHVP01061756.1.p1  ORF type:complete len:145 (+),score=8.94 GHVP01061756.1:565-999(+)